MFKLLDHRAVDREWKEFDEVESILSGMTLPTGGWRFGARLIHGMWRVIIRVDTLEYDIAIMPYYTSQQDAIAHAISLSKDMGGVPMSNGGEA